MYCEYSIISTILKDINKLSRISIKFYIPEETLYLYFVYRSQFFKGNGCSLWRKWKSMVEILIWMEMGTIPQMIQRLPWMESLMRCLHSSITVKSTSLQPYVVRMKCSISIDRTLGWLFHQIYKQNILINVMLVHHFLTAEIAWHERRREWVGDRAENVQREPMEPILRYSFSFKHPLFLFVEEGFIFNTVIFKFQFI